MSKTIRVPDELHEEVTQVAADRKVTTAEALRIVLETGDTHRSPRVSQRFESSTDIPGSQPAEPFTGEPPETAPAQNDMAASIHRSSVGQRGAAAGDASVDVEGANDVTGEIFEQAMLVLERRGGFGARIADAARHGILGGEVQF